MIEKNGTGRIDTLTTMITNMGVNGEAHVNGHDRRVEGQNTANKPADTQVAKPSARSGIDISDIIAQPQSETFKTRTVLSRISHGKPATFDQFRVHPGLPLVDGASEVRRLIVLGILKDTDAAGKRYEFATSNAVLSHYENRGLVVRHTVYLAMSRRSRKPFLWTIKTPGIGDMHQSSKDQLNYAEMAVDRWVAMKSWDGTTYGEAELDLNAAATWKNPDWSVISSWDHAIRLAFPGNELITDINNPLILDMIGQAPER